MQDVLCGLGWMRFHRIGGGIDEVGIYSIISMAHFIIG
jgi:hypothetical protein